MYGTKPGSLLCNNVLLIKCLSPACSWGTSPASPGTGTAQPHTQEADEGSLFAYPQTLLVLDLELFEQKEECVSFLVFGSIYA